MKLLKSSALLTRIILSFGLINASQKDLKIAYNNYLKMSAPEQIMVMGFMRRMAPKVNQIARYMATHRVKLGNGGLIPAESVLRMNDVGTCSLYFNNNQFSVGNGTKTYMIPKYDTDGVLSKLDQESIRRYLTLGKIGISRGTDGKYLLRLYTRAWWWISYIPLDSTGII